MTKVFVCLKLEDAQLSRLTSSVEAAQIEYFPDPVPDPDAQRAFRECEIVFGNPPPEWIGPPAVTRWIQLESVGFGEYATLGWQDMKGKPVMTNLAGFFSEPVAESILAGVLCHARGIGTLRSLQDRRQWAGDSLRTTLATLDKSHVVLLGSGDINRRVAELLAPFHSHITAFGRGFDRFALECALSAADVVICCVPHTPETRGLFGRELIAKLKPSALFVNFGRGSLIDEDALADALDAGQLGGAIIDVTQDEPLPNAHRFWSTPNLLLTQHTGGGTADEIDRKIDHFLDNLDRYRRGEPLLHQIDFTRGY